MLQLWRKLFARGKGASAHPAIVEPVGGAQSAGEQGVMSPQARQALLDFVRIMTSELADRESVRLVQAVAENADAGWPAEDAICLSMLEKQQRGQWVLIQLDGKGQDDIEWQTDELLSLHGVSDQWCWSRPPGSWRTVVQGLHEFSEWLAPRDLHLLHIVTSCDNLYAFVVDSCQLEQSLSLARTAGLLVQRAAEFKRANDDGVSYRIPSGDAKIG